LQIYDFSLQNSAGFMIHMISARLLFSAIICLSRVFMVCSNWGAWVYLPVLTHLSNVFVSVSVW